MKAKLINKALAWLMTLIMVASMLPVSVFAAGGNVAKVGDTEYATIDEAIANWTNGTTLTLLADVTLSDVIKLSSTEYHILDLGTYTMTAASKKDAIQIVNNGRASASYALDIKADAENPGGITASGKAVVRTSGKSGVQDRPIIRFYNGVFTGMNVVYHSGSNGTKCPQFWFYGGEFNGTVFANRAKFIFFGGTFNGALQISVDTSADALVVGGTFKQLSNMYGSALNNDKFTIGSAAGVYDKEVYVDDNGYFVVAAAQPAEGVEAGVAMAPGTNDYFAYSKVATEGALNYTDATMALEKNNTSSAKITVYVDELDLTGINFKGTIVAPEGKTLTITNAPDGLKTEGNVVVVRPAVKIGAQGYDTLTAAVAAAKDGDVITVVADIADEAVSVNKNVTITGSVAANNVSISAEDGCTELTVSGLSFTGNSWINAGDADKLTVSGVTADVTPSSAAATNSRSAFISLGRSEGKELDLTVTDCNIVSKGGTDPILGWAKVDEVTISGSTFGSASAPQTNSDSIKFMSIADGAVLNFTGNTVYSNYNGIVLAQNTTRDNAYTANFSGNTFVGGADHIWIEISGGDTCHATVNVASDNTVNGNAFAAADIKAHTGVIKNWSSYAGVDVMTDAEGKVIGGTLAFAAADAIAEGYEMEESGKVVASAPAYVAEVDGVGYTDIQEAIKAAAPAGTVTLLSDVTVDKWAMISETLSIGGGQIITLDMSGLTIDGNGYTLTVNAIESANNGDHLIYDGDYNVQELTIKVADGVNGGLGITSGTIRNVTFVGGNLGVIPNDGQITGVHADNVTIEGCTFKVNGQAIYYETAQDGLVVNGNTFEIPSTSNVIVMYGAETFTNNTVVSGRTVNVASGSPVVTGNNFNDVRFKVYNDATAIIENNTINNLAFNDETVAQSTFTGNTLSESAQAALDAVTASNVAEVNGVPYTTLSAAFAAVTSDDDTVTILSDVTEELTGAYLRGNIVAEDDVTITLTNTDWVYLNYTFVVGENVTLKAPALFYYAGGAQIKGTVITDAYYQRYAGTKLTINEPGSLTVNTEMFYLRYMDSDPNAGIYVVGDNDDSTVGLNLSVAYFYQGMINAKDATIKTAVYWQTNETDGTGSANLVLDNTKMTVTGSELDSAATGNSTVTLTNGSILTCAGNFVTGDNTAVSVDATSKIIARGQVLEFGLSGSGTEADPFVIASVDDLILFRDSVNAGDTKYNAEGVYVALGADIDLAGENWVGIGSIAQPHGFMGNFDGKNFKIKNLTITDPTLDSDGYAYAGLFSITEGTDKDNQNVIKNLTIENVTISTTGHIVSAAIAYPYYTIVDNVTVCGDINIIGGNYTAGALAYTRRCVNASNVTVSGSVGSAITGAQVVGGVISDIQMNGGLTAAYSNFHAEGLTINGTKNVGGISGIIATQTLTGATVKNVVINGADTRKGIVSGVLGGTSTIKSVTYENVTGATAIIGGTYDAGAAVEAKIGNTYYATLDDALVAAQTGETIELLAPIVVAAGESLTLDKAVTITYTSNVPGEDMITNRGTLVIDGATLVYTNNDITGSNVTVSTISSAPGSVLTVNSGVVKNDSANNSKGGAGSFAYAIDLLTNGGLGDVTATINGGEVISTNYMAIRQFVNGETCKNTLTVNGGIIQGATRGINIQLKNNMAYTTINGGTIKGGDYALCFLTTSENLSVMGGEFKGEVWYSGTDGFITGGTFDSDVTDYCAEGYTCKQNADGTYGIMETATELFTLAGITTSLDSSLALNIYYTPLSGATATDYYAVVAHQKEDTVEETTIPYADWGTSGSKKLVRYTGLAAKEMADELTVTIYDANGNAVSKSYTTSFRAYAIGMMSSGQYDPIKHRVWFTALTDMLNYGAAAQQMFGYKTDNLANAGTDAFQQYASTEYALSTAGFSMSGTAWAPSLTLESTILLNFYFNDVTEGMYATYSYTTHAGTPTSATVDYNSFVSGWGHFGVAVPIAIADAGTPVTVTMFKADGTVAGTMTCSANNYLKGMTENNPDVALYPALAKFAASAKTAFAN